MKSSKNKIVTESALEMMEGQEDIKESIQGGEMAGNSANRNLKRKTGKAVDLTEMLSNADD